MQRFPAIHPKILCAMNRSQSHSVEQKIFADTKTKQRVFKTGTLLTNEHSDPPFFSWFQEL